MANPPDPGTTRVWRHLQAEVPSLETAAQQSVLRLALKMWVMDTRSRLTPEERHQWNAALAAHVEKGTCLTAAEVAAVREPLLAFLGEYYPRIVETVSLQFVGTHTGDNDART